MEKGNRVILLVFGMIFLAILLAAPQGNERFLIADAAPDSPYQGTGVPIDVHEFAQNVSSVIHNQVNGSSFTYDSNWYPTGYRGYHLQANVSDVYRYTNPLPNGDFENLTAFSSTWNLTNLEPYDPIVSSISPVLGQNPTYVMDVDLADKRLLWQRTAYIDNDFNYTSTLIPNYLLVRFEIKLSTFFTAEDWLYVKIEIWNEGSLKGSWVKHTRDLRNQYGDNWGFEEFTTAGINGEVKLRITIFKQETRNEYVIGHIYFDNFEYIIGSQVTPSEAGLTLNGHPVNDLPLSSDGSVDIYADPNYREAIPWANSWSTDQMFQFYSLDFSNISFNYQYGMYVKNLTLAGASTTFSAPVNGIPTWTIQYIIPGGRPPPGHVTYSFGFHLFAGWEVTNASGSFGPLSVSTIHPPSNFIKIGDNEAEELEICEIQVTSQNYLKQVVLQKRTTPLDSWENLKAGGYYFHNDYLRVMAELEPIYPNPSNFANVSIYYPNGTRWVNDEIYTFFENNNTFVSDTWQLTDVDDAILGQNWIVTVAFSNETQCGNRQIFFTLVVDTGYTRVGWTDGTSFLWQQDSIDIEVTWYNNHTGTPISDATIYRVRYLDRNLVFQYVTMTPDGLGGYSTSVFTNLMEPNPNAEIYVELFRYGCVNASYDESTQITFTFNLIGKIDLVMVKPTLITGPNEYTGETSAIAGYTSIVKFYDPYQGAFVSDGIGPWPSVIVNYTSYEWNTTSSSWTFTGTGFFTHNAVDRTFSKNDPSYGSIEKIRYNVSMRIEGYTWEYQTHDFIIIINIGNYATNLDALRTTIEYPPTGDGWTLFDQNLDNYEVHIYWNENFNVTVYYENVTTSTGLLADTVKIQIGGLPQDDMSSLPTTGYYYYSLDTISFDVGVIQIYITASKSGYSTQTILIQLYIESRKTELTKDQPGSTAILPWGGTFSVTFNFTDIVETASIPITDAIVIITHPGLPAPTIINHTDGTYTIIISAMADENIYSVVISFNRDNYQTKLQNYELTIRSISTLGLGLVDTPTVPWSENVLITLNFTDVDNFIGIPGATISFTSHGIWLTEGTDYWITPYGDGTYTITLNTTKIPQGTHGYAITFTFTKDHYQTTQTVVFFQVRDIQTILFITDTPQGTVIPHGDILTIVLQFNNTDHSPQSIIAGATISCNWDSVFWNVTYDAGQGVYIIKIQTGIQPEGNYQLNIGATKQHYLNGNNILNFWIRTIRTTVNALHDYESVPIGDNVTFTITYEDLDHPGNNISFANIAIDWDPGFYTIIDNGGTYLIILNTSSSSVGIHSLQIDVELPPHYDSQTIFVTLDITRIPLIIKLINPFSGQWDVEYNTPVNITVQITDHLLNPVNDAYVAYSWADRGFVNMTWIGNGLYNVSFLANASIGFNHQVTIRASNPAKYTAITSIMLISIRPTDTKFENITPANFDTVIGDSFTVSVNFTTPDGLPINAANVSYVLRDRGGAELKSGFFVNVGPGTYNATIDTIGLLYDEYDLFVSASKETMSQKELRFKVNLTKIPTAIMKSLDQIEVFTTSTFVVSVTFYDIHNNYLISDANLTITIEALQLFSVRMTNHHNGTYSYTGNSGLNTGTFFIIIEAIAPSQYQTPEAITLNLVVNPNPLVQNIGSYVAIIAVIVMIMLITWFAYARVFSVPWMVRKIRKMSKTIGKGDIPRLSKMEITRISDRSDIISDLISPNYAAIGLPVSTLVLPREIDWREKEAEDEAIWGELKNLPFIEYEQKLELFQQMKQIPAAERMWFLDDLKKQMEDGTRFARKPREPELKEDIEQELQQRLATFPRLSSIEKQRIAAQLRKLPKEEWDEVFHTLAVSDKPQVIKDEMLGPDEFPALSEAERQRVLDEIRDLTPEEQQKVLSTLREKKDKDMPKGKVVKGKKKFVMDDSEEGK